MLGHKAGDWLLQEIVRVSDTSFAFHGYCRRMGGDEFVVLIEEIENRANIHRCP